ncbi:MAG: xanthine dehydrogenase family protein subunit M [Anaerolineales bacterium]|nr:MAG: xanthine dehydrogenase family protein subunit M [Anaerolineales bacterium]
MKPFEYYAATSIQEAIALLNQAGRVFRPLAGGTDLLVQLRHGLRQTDAVVDIKRIPELNKLSYDPGTGLIVGAVISCARLCTAPDVRNNYPGLVDAASIIGGSAIQERASLGGNLCNAAPSGDSIPAMIVLGATCTIAGPEGIRTLPVEDICTNPGQTVLKKGELLVSIHFPPHPANTGAAYFRFTPRREMDIAVAGAGAWVALSKDRQIIMDARIAMAAVAPTPLLVKQAGAALVGCEPDETSITKAAEVAEAFASPITDMRGTIAQRRHLVKVLVQRALRQAILRAKSHTS